MVVIKQFFKDLVRRRTNRDNVPINEDAEQEIKLHAYLCSRIRHPSVLQMLDLFQDHDMIYVVLELCALGEMFTIIRDLHGSNGNISLTTPPPLGSPTSPPLVLTLQSIPVLFRHIVEGVHFLHSQHIAHRDMSLENLLLTADGQAKICPSLFSDRIRHSYHLSHTNFHVQVTLASPSICFHLPNLTWSLWRIHHMLCVIQP